MNEMIKDKLSFILSVLAIIVLGVLGYSKAMEVTTAISTVVSVYVMGKAGQKAAQTYFAAQDPKVDTNEAIRAINQHP